MQWFRFYTEAVSDKKLRRIARDNGESMAHVLGVWTIVLSMASDSPERGKLLISDEVPATIDDINDAAGCNVTATFQKLLVTGIVTVGVTEDGQTVYVVPAWDKRQFESDSSATRVRRHRERKKAEENGENVTMEKRYSNAPDTDTDTDTDSNTNVPADAEPTALAVSVSYADRYHASLEQLKQPKANKAAILLQIYKDCFGDHELPQYSYIASTAKNVGGAGRLAQLMYERITNPPTGDVLAHIIASENGRKKRAAQTGGNREIAEVQFTTNGGDIYG